MAAAGRVRPQESEVTSSSQRAVKHIPLSGDGPQNLHWCVRTCQPRKSPGQSSFTPVVRITRQGAEGHSFLSVTSGWGLSSGSPCLSLVVWGGKETLASMQHQQTLGEFPRPGNCSGHQAPGVLCAYCRPGAVRPLCLGHRWEAELGQQHGQGYPGGSRWGRPRPQPPAPSLQACGHGTARWLPASFHLPSGW